MAKKGYQIKKEGDFWVIPAGYVAGQYHKEIRTMNREKAEDVVRARKSISLKRKYPEIRKGISETKSNQKPTKVDWKLQELKDVPDYIHGGPFLFKLHGSPSNHQVTTANESYYKHRGYKTVVLKTKEGRYALYVEEKK